MHISPTHMHLIATASTWVPVSRRVGFFYYCDSWFYWEALKTTAEITCRNIYFWTSKKWSIFGAVHFFVAFGIVLGLIGSRLDVIFWYFFRTNFSTKKIYGFCSRLFIILGATKNASWQKKIKAIYTFDIAAWIYAADIS